MIEIARLNDGRSVTSDEDTGSFSIGGTTITLPMIIAYDRVGQLTWVDDTKRAFVHETERARRSAAAATHAVWSFVVGAACIAFMVVVGAFGAFAPLWSWAPRTPVLEAAAFIFAGVGALLLTFGAPVGLAFGFEGRHSRRRGFAIAGIVMNAASLAVAVGAILAAMAMA